MSKEQSTPKIVELKAAAYDALANIEAWQGRLREINAKIAEAQKLETDKNKDNE